jgi:anthranilate phosphoribosyltransferase
MSDYEHAMARLRAGSDLDRAEAEQLMGDVMDGEVPAEDLAVILASLAQKGERAQELAGFAAAMRARAIRIRSVEGAVDTCGTGGSGLATVNTSTLVALTLAAAGVSVAKHGNRASSGACGSSDVLEKAGVPIGIPPVDCERLLEEQGLAFLFAPLFHPAMKIVGPVRKALGIRTVFNFLGPLCNPAGVRRQLLGVSSREHAPVMSRALADLGCERGIVACGADGLDELSPVAATDLWIVENGEIEERTVTPSDFGLSPVAPEDIAGGSPDENLKLFEELIDGRSGPRADHLALNAAAGLYVAGEVDVLADGVELARDLLRAGRVRETFESYRSAAQAMQAVGP